MVDATGQKGSAHPSSVQAMKVQSPPCPWEFYMCKVLQGRVPPVSRSSFLRADMLYLLPKHSVMLSPYGKRGTLQDLLNAYLRKGKVSMTCAHLACMASLQGSQCTDLLNRQVLGDRCQPVRVPFNNSYHVLLSDGVFLPVYSVMDRVCRESQLLRVLPQT